MLLTTYRNDIYSRPTVAYNTTKEGRSTNSPNPNLSALPCHVDPPTHSPTSIAGFGFMSLLWHAHVAHCMYSWIVRKVSAIRLRRRRIPALALAVVGISIGRYYLFWTLRDGMLGLYLSTLIFDGFMVGWCIGRMPHITTHLPCTRESTRLTITHYLLPTNVATLPHTGAHGGGGDAVLLHPHDAGAQPR